jgi:hypothetical protein
MNPTMIQTNQSKFLQVNHSQFMRTSQRSYRTNQGVFASDKKENNMKRSGNLMNYSKNYHDFIPKSKQNNSLD